MCYNTNKCLIFSTKNGLVKRTNIEEFEIVGEDVISEPVGSYGWKVKYKNRPAMMDELRKL